MIKTVLLLLLTACASGEKPVAGIERHQRKFSTPNEAQNFISNKARYLTLLFEQSHDPYYNTPKWSEDCLARNQIGKVENRNGHVVFRSRLLLDSQGEAGNCNGKPMDVIYVQCGDIPIVTELRCFPTTCDSGNYCSQ